MNASLSEAGGFTLIELVLVISLLVLSVGISSDIIISLVRSYNKTQVTNEIEQTANFVALKIEQDLRNAVSVSTPSSVGSGSSILEFESTDGDTVRYQLNNDVVVKIVGGASSNITDNTVAGGGVSVSCPYGCFTLLNISPVVVRINMSFSQAGTSVNKIFTGSVDIDNTVVIRGTY